MSQPIHWSYTLSVVFTVFFIKCAIFVKVVTLFLITPVISSLDVMMSVCRAKCLDAAQLGNRLLSHSSLSRLSHSDKSLGMRALEL